MPTPTACRVCSGPLELLRRGSDSEYEPSAFSPSYHRAGTHGDLYRCGNCGTINQLSLPRGSELRDLYRAMSDKRYLREEEGRRRMARRLLDLLAEYMPDGRLLQVGSGYGLLLDEARRRGYDVEGVDLSVEAVRHARERLGLSVQEMALEDATLDAMLDGKRYDAVVAVDVLEHLDDPVVALERMCALLSPGGALLITTPNPAALLARVTGVRWWGYEPAHVCLIPRKTLHELIAAQGLIVVEDTTAAQSFTLGYWLTCLSERGSGPGARGLAYVAARLPRTLMLTASLGDELVLLARSVENRVPVGGTPNARLRADGCGVSGA